MVAGETAVERADNGHGANTEHQRGGNESLRDGGFFVAALLFETALHPVGKSVQVTIEVT